MRHDTLNHGNPRLGIAVLTVGFSGLVAQLVLLRELLVVFSGNELSIGIVLANWLILEATGSFLLGKTAERIAHKFEAFACLALLFSVSLPASIYVTRILKSLLGLSIGESVGLAPILYSSFLILLPTSVFHGALFTFGCGLHSVCTGRTASSAGRVYVMETIGTIIGGIAWTYLLIPYLHAFHMATIIAIVNAGACMVLLVPCRKRGRAAQAALAATGLFLLCAGGFAATGGMGRLHRRSIDAQWRGQNVVHYQNSIYGNICVIESAGQYTFFVDGMPTISAPIPDIAFVEEFTHLPLLSHPRPQRVLVLSGGAGGVIGEILNHPSVERVEYAELDPLLLELLRTFPTALTEAELTDPRVDVSHIDGRLFLRLTPHTYDVILVGIPGPSDLQTNRFFTREFFALARQRLNGNGLLAFGLPGSLTYLNDELRDLNACIFNTAGSELPSVRPIPRDGTNLFLAARAGDMTLPDKGVLVERLLDRGLEPDRLLPWHIEHTLHPRWVDWFDDFIDGGTQAINRDFKPLGLFYNIAHWNALHTPSLRGLFDWAEAISLPKLFVFFAIISVIASIAASRRQRAVSNGVAWCIATTGFAGMVFDLALIFAFQAMYGYVFSWVGLLITAFMAGSACGAIIMNSALPNVTDERRLFVKIDIAVICYSLTLPMLFLILRPVLDSPAALGSLRYAFLPALFVGGSLVGLQFPLANSICLKDSDDLSRTAGLLYGADLLGGWLGGVVGGVLILPVLGLVGACMAVVMMKLTSLAVTLAPWKIKRRLHHA